MGWGAGAGGGGVGEGLKREGIYVYLKVIHVIVQQKLTQHCKAIILPLRHKLQKKKKKKEHQGGGGVLTWAGNLETNFWGDLPPTVSISH